MQNASLTATNVPIAASDYYYLPQSGPLTVTAAQGVLANDFDSSNTPLQAVLTQAPVSGSLTLNSDGSFTYTPGVNQTVTFQYEARVGASGATSLPVTVTLVAYGQGPTVSLERLAFLNGNTLRPDDGSPAPLQAQWLSSAPTQGDPVAYTEDTVMSIQAIFHVSDPSQFQGPIQMQGQGGGLLIAGIAELDGSGNLVLRLANVQLPNVIQALEPLQITWQVQPAGGQATGTLLAAGASNNRFYEMGGEAPKGKSLYETVVAVGTKGAAGKDTETDKFNGIWNLFKSPGAGKPPPGIMRSPDADGKVAPLTYYGSWDIAIGIQNARKEDPTLPPPETTASLLKRGDAEPGVPGRGGTAPGVPSRSRSSAPETSFGPILLCPSRIEGQKNLTVFMHRSVTEEFHHGKHGNHGKNTNTNTYSTCE